MRKLTSLLNFVIVDQQRDAKDNEESASEGERTFPFNTSEVRFQNCLEVVGPRPARSVFIRIHG